MIRKKAKLLKFFFLLFTTSLFGAPIIPQTSWPERIDVEPQEDELIAINRIISLTQKQQEAQLELKKSLIQLKEAREMFLKADGSKLHAIYMMRAAKVALPIIKTYHLDHLFTDDFMEELTILAQLGKNKAPNVEAQ